MFQVKRIYEQREPADGYRVLVDRVWPRGMTKEAAAIDLWLKEAAPSTTLRKWFAHEPARWAEFKRRYAAELEQPDSADTVERLKQLAQEHAVVTLLFSARDETHNQAIALREILTD